MPTFAQKKDRTFDDDTYPRLVKPSRSDGRLKNYQSNTDQRSWCFSIEDRRQHILDWVKAPTRKCAGKFVPIEAILGCLLSSKDAIIDDLKRQLAACMAGKDTSKPKKGCGGRTKKTCKKTGKTPANVDEYDVEGEEEWDAVSTYSAKTAYSTKTTFESEDVLKNKLDEKEKECQFFKNAANRAIDQLEELQGIVDERNVLKRKLKESIHELETLKIRVQDPCMMEIATLESEIERLRTTNRLSIEEEIQVIEKEASILKKYCNKINSIQEENVKLQSQLTRLEELSGIPSNFENVEETCEDVDELRRRVVELKKRFAKLNEIIDERDKMKNRIKQLEVQLSQYANLPEEVDVIRKRSSILDDVLNERDRLAKRLGRMKGLEHTLAVMKQKADRTAELELKIANLNLEIGEVRRRSADEVGELLAENDNLKSMFESAKSEARQSKSDIDYAESEIDRLRREAKQADVYRLERDRLKLRLEELASGDADTMSENCKCLGTLRAERDKYKFRYEELLGMECECDMLRGQVDNLQQTDKEHEELTEKFNEREELIERQNEEIKRLNEEIDQLNTTAEEEKVRLEEEISRITEEIKEKDSLIGHFKEQLENVKNQLATTIGSVASESTQMKVNIDSLDTQLTEANSKIQMLETEKRRLSSLVDEQGIDIEGLQRRTTEEHRKSEQLEHIALNKDEIIQKLEEEVETLKAENGRLLDMVKVAIVTDQHLDEILKHSKCAVKRITEKLR